MNEPEKAPGANGGSPPRTAEGSEGQTHFTPENTQSVGASASRIERLSEIPSEMRERPQWVAATADKVPIDPTTGRNADVNDPKTWGTFEAAVQCGHPHVGFVLTAHDPYVVIDLDDKPEKPASDEDLALFAAFIEDADSYTERSTSGRGYHIIVRGHMEPGRRRERVEMYAEKRYMICTGDVVVAKPINDGQDFIDKQLARMPPAVAGVELTDEPEREDDATLLDKARNAGNREKFEDLWSGRWVGMTADNGKPYPSQSEADYALLSILTFYTSSNEQVRRLFRASELGQRAKATQDDKYLDRSLRKIRAKHRQEEERAREEREAIMQDVMAGAEKEHEQGSEQAERALFPPGMVGKVAAYIDGAAYRQMREAAIVGALALVAGIAGRTYNVSRYGLQQYLIFVAESGFGKDSINDGIEYLIDALERPVKGVEGAKIDFAAAGRFIGPAEMASPQAVLRHLPIRPCFVSMLGEIGDLFIEWSKAKPGTGYFQMQRLLRDLFSKSGGTKVLREKIYADAENNTSVVASPNMTIVGDTTPDNFFSALDVSQIKSGLLSRFSIIEYTGPRPTKNLNQNIEASPELVDWLAALMQTVTNHAGNNAPVVHIGFDAGGKRVLDAFEDECEDRREAADIEYRELWNRAHLKALKVAGLLAVGGDMHRPTVTAEMATWAVEFIRGEVCAIYARFDRGAFGDGDQWREASVLGVMKDFERATPEQRKSYDVPDSLLRGNAVPYTYLRRRLNSNKGFSDYPRGYKVAIDKTLGDLEAARQVQKLLRPDRQELGIDPRVSDVWLRVRLKNG